jgi:hypothetical protein
MISWVSFLYFESVFKEKIKRLKGIREEEKLDNISLIISSSLVGMINLALVLPFDMVKTQY